MFKTVILLLRNAPFILWTFIETLRLYAPLREARCYREQGELDKERDVCAKNAAIWARRMCAQINLRVTVEQEADLPGGPVLLVSNHQSHADIPIFFMAVPDKQFGFIAKRSLRVLPVYGKWIEEIHSVFIERNDARSALKAMEDGIALIEQGYSLVVFPEGTRSLGGPMGEFKKGSLRLATKPGIPIVPITLDGTYHVLEEKGVVQKDKEVRIFVHRPIETAGMSRQEINALTKRVEEVISAKLDEWREE